MVCTHTAAYRFYNTIDTIYRIVLVLNEKCLSAVSRKTCSLNNSCSLLYIYTAHWPVYCIYLAVTVTVEGFPETFMHTVSSPHLNAEWELSEELL